MTCSSETISISWILDKNHFRFCVQPEGPAFLVKATINLSRRSQRERLIQ